MTRPNNQRYALDMNMEQETLNKQQPIQQSGKDTTATVADVGNSTRLSTLKPRRFLVWLAHFSALLTLVTIGSLLTLIHNEGILPKLIALSRPLIPGTLHIEHISGPISGPVEIRGLVYQYAGLDIKINQLRLSWDLTALLRLQLAVREVAISQVSLTLPPSPTSPQPDKQFLGLTLPLGIALERVTVTDLSIHVANSAPIFIDKLSLTAQASNNRIEIAQFVTAAFGGAITAAGHVDLLPNFPTALHIKWSYISSSKLNLTGEGLVNGNLTNLYLEQFVQAPAAIKIVAKLTNLTTLPQWDAQITLSKLNLTSLAPNLLGDLTGKLHTTGNPAAIDLQGRLELNTQNFGTVMANLDTAYNGKNLAIKRLILTTPNNEQITLAGQYTPGPDLGKFAINLNWQNLRWPLIGKPSQFNSPKGSAKLAGQLNAYTYSLTGPLIATQMPPIDITTNGNGNLHSLNLSALSIKLPKGKITGNATITWDPTISWIAKIKGAGLDPSILNHDFPGRIAMDLDVKGNLTNGQVNLDTDLNYLRGVLRGYPLKSAAVFSLNGSELSLSKLEINSGTNQLYAKGNVGKTLNLDWRLNASNLKTFWPGLTGELNAQGHAAGALSTPIVQANIHGAEITYVAANAPQQQLAYVRKIIINTDINLATPGKVILNLNADHVTVANQQWSKLELIANGTKAAHQISLALTGLDVPTGQLTMNAGITSQQLWQGTLEHLELNIPNLSTWKLRRATAFTVSAITQNLENLCLDAAIGTLCGSVNNSNTRGWAAQLNPVSLDLNVFKHWLPSTTQLTGQVQLQAQANATTSGRIQADAHLTLPKGVLKLAGVTIADQLEFSGTDLLASLDTKEGKIAFQVPLREFGTVQGTLSLPEFNPMQINLDQQLINGRLQANLPNLGFLVAISPQIANVTGKLEIDYSLVGRLTAPNIQGQALLADGSVDIPALGLNLEKISLQAKGSNSKILYTGSLHSSTGELQVTGDTNVGLAMDLSTNLELTGQDVLVMNLPEAEIKISPRMQIKYQSGRMDINGEVRVPSARIRPRSLPTSAVINSKDLIIIDANKPKSKPHAASLNLRANIWMRLEKQVSFDGFGLRGKPTGDLLVVLKPGYPLFGRGRIGIIDGTYKAYGQDLQIQRGYALFADTPLDNPGLDVQAARSIDNVNAGIRITGTLTKPSLTLFSTPTMAQNDILSYILLGKPMSKLGNSNSDARTELTSALAASGINRITDEMARQLGMDELRVSTNSTGLASVQAGIDISPRLHAQYAITPNDRSATTTLRYDLTKSLQIQTESGKNQGIDLFYSIER